MNGSKLAELIVQPALTRLGRWGVYLATADSPKAEHPATIGTLLDNSTASSAAAGMRRSLEDRGWAIEVRNRDARKIQGEFQRVNLNETELEKLLKDYAETSLAKLTKIKKAAILRSPPLFSVVVLIAILFPASIGEFLIDLLPTYLGFAVANMASWVPGVILVITIWQYLNSRRLSAEQDRVRNWVLRLTLEYGWRRSQFTEIIEKEVAKLRYAYLADSIESASWIDPAPMSDTVERLFNTIRDLRGEITSEAQRDDEATSQTRSIMKEAIEEDFERKSQRYLHWSKKATSGHQGSLFSHSC